MNKKGFTLLEVLAVISIIGIIATMLSVNIINYFNESENYKKETLANIYIAASNVYINKKENKNFKKECKKDGCFLTSDTLLKNKLLESDDITNPVTIYITFKNKRFIYEIKEVE